MIDVRTTYGLIAVVLLIAPIAILLTTRGMRNRQIYCWVAANAAHGLAYILVGLRDSIPDAMSYHLAQVLLLSSAFLRVHTIRVIAAPDHYHLAAAWPFLGWLLAYMAVFSWAMATDWPEQDRITFVISVQMGLLFWLLYKAGQLGRDHESQGLRLLQWAALIALVGYGLRLLSIHILGEGAYIFAGAPLHTIAVMCILGFALLSNIAFLRMILEASELDRHLTRGALTASQSAASRYALKTPQASIEAFGSVISHELNQPLTAMQLNLEHLQRQQRLRPTNPAFQEVLGDLLHDVNRATILVKNLRTLLSGRSVQLERVDLWQSARGATDLFNRFAPSQHQSVEIRLLPESNPGVLAMANPDQLTQVLLNLLVNATEAVSSSGSSKPVSIVIEVSTGSASTAQISLTDNGPGIPAAQRETLFDLFATTKARAGGVGLWLSKYILQAQGANIRLDLEHASGARFVVVFPSLHQST